MKATGRCFICGDAAYSRFARFCDRCFRGSKPASIEYAVRRAIRLGELKPVKECICVDCGAPARHYDHRDYNKPTDVEPVCARCNSRRGPATRYGKTRTGELLPTTPTNGNT